MQWDEKAILEGFSNSLTVIKKQTNLPPIKKYKVLEISSLTVPQIAL